MHKFGRIYFSRRLGGKEKLNKEIPTAGLIDKGENR